MNPAQQVMQVATSYMATTALYAALELKLPDALASGPQSAAQLAALSGAMEDPIFRVLRLLASLGLCEETAPRTFALTPAGQLLRSDVPGSLRNIAYMVSDPTHFQIYANVMHSMKTGRPATEYTWGMPPFEYLARNPAYAKVFNDAMTSFSAPIGNAALEAYDFSGIGTLVDVAGGHGEILMLILKAHPTMRGIVCDLEHVVEGATPRIAAAGLSDRMRAVPCDFFASIPDGGDAYIMKHILHDWYDDKASVILKNIARAMGPKKGKVILLESVIAAGNAPDLGKFIDIEMMLFPGGKERTEAEFGALFASAGFTLTKVVPTRSPVCVIEAVRN
jgi:hypothetical protein